MYVNAHKGEDCQDDQDCYEDVQEAWDVQIALLAVGCGLMGRLRLYAAVLLYAAGLACIPALVFWLLNSS